MLFSKSVFAGGCAILAAGLVSAQNEAFQASLTPEHALHGRDTRIEGVALSVWGENPQSALAIGFVNGSTGLSRGLSFGLVNYAESYSGAQWSLVNFAHADMSGWQGGPVFGLIVSALNYCGGNMNGLQTGLVNLSGGMSGVQVGVVNYAQRMEAGLQVGLVNLIGNTGGWFTNWPNEVAPCMVLANWKF
ncbi:MAG TPA: hypothetical protein PLU38_10670 [Kiritimatiellia bacterium]|nr:hypothetical protein [Kiritimatiellia bacterium]